MAPDVNVERLNIPATKRERKLFDKAAAASAPQGHLPNRAAWLRAVALKQAGEADLLAREVADAERIREGWEVLVPLTAMPSDLEKVREAARKNALPVAAFIRACALAEARRLGVK